VVSDGLQGQEHERERGFGGVEAVGATRDQPDLVVERFGAALVDPEAHTGEDPVAVFADRRAEPDERAEAAAGSCSRMRTSASSWPR
jgi:hypothetical protein